MLDKKAAEPYVSNFKSLSSVPSDKLKAQAAQIQTMLPGGVYLSGIYTIGNDEEVVKRTNDVIKLFLDSIKKESRLYFMQLSKKYEN
jgi:hypothetical protein